MLFGWTFKMRRKAGFALYGATYGRVPSKSVSGSARHLPSTSPRFLTVVPAAIIASLHTLKETRSRMTVAHWVWIVVSFIIEILMAAYVWMNFSRLFLAEETLGTGLLKSIKNFRR
ncbi:hypothetical protein BC832DRAFT_566704 [Gaertneriomyces semiglobifer]|nr:hypothetical protein BC832DRAFT_566704 [Gaertneriomyces semiglobifer]